MTGDVLITGATGLIGGEIALRLMKAGRRVWCVIRSGTFAEAAAPGWNTGSHCPAHSATGRGLSPCPET
jgi:nucleoside-diphosphate-sugar epimerase